MALLSKLSFGVLLLALLSRFFFSSQNVIGNLHRLQIVQDWLAFALVDLVPNDALQDGIPDSWQPYAWGGATRSYRLVESGALDGNRAIRIENTNVSGAATLIQDIPVEPGSHLVSTVYARGTAGALQIWFRPDNGVDWVRTGVGGWKDIVPSEGWRQHQLSVTVPSGHGEARLLLRTGGVVDFDNASVVVIQGGKAGPNLLANPGFEKDGVREPPLVWWQRHVVRKHNKVDSTYFLNENDGPGYRNMADMLAGRYDAIQARARQLSDDCGARSEMFGWLAVLGNRLERVGGDAARERLYQLAVELIPNCPQPYAALADLYQAHNAFDRAVELYDTAAERAGESPAGGRYSFEAGLLYVRKIGDLNRAVQALHRAELLAGWESGTWYHGIASLELGGALELQGNFSEAAAAYQRVLDCSTCDRHHASAAQALDRVIPYARD